MVLMLLLGANRGRTRSPGETRKPQKAFTSKWQPYIRSISAVPAFI